MPNPHLQQTQGSQSFYFQCFELCGQNVIILYLSGNQGRLSSGHDSASSLLHFPAMGVTCLYKGSIDCDAGVPFLYTDDSVLKGFFQTWTSVDRSQPCGQLAQNRMLFVDYSWYIYEAGRFSWVTIKARKDTVSVLDKFSRGRLNKEVI